MGRKHRKKLWAIILVCILVGGVLLAGFWQRNNLKALWLAFTSDSETLAAAVERQEEKRQELLDKYGLEFTPNSAGTQTEVPAETGGGSVPEPSETPSSTPGSTPTGDDKGDEGQGQDSQQAQQVINGYIQQLYDLESSYRSQLDELVSQTKTEFWSLPKEEQTKSNKIALVKTKMDLLIAAENQCDADVEAVLGQLEQAVKAAGMDTQLVADIRAQYEDDKATYKAACMTELYK